RFKSVQESLGGKLQKSFDETKQRLAELGERILRELLPVLDKLIPLVNKALDLFSKLPDNLKLGAIAFVALQSPILNIATAVGKLTSSITGLNAASLGTGLSRLASIFGTGAGAVGGLSGVLGLGAFGTGLAITLSEQDLNERIEGMRRQGQPLEEALRQRQ